MKRIFGVIVLLLGTFSFLPVANAAGSSCISLGFPSVTSSASTIRVSVPAKSNCKTPFGMSSGGAVYTILNESSSTYSCSGPYDYSNFGGGTINCTINLGGSFGSNRAFATSSTIQIWFAYDFSTKQVTFNHAAIPSKSTSGGGSTGGSSSGSGPATPVAPSCTAAPNIPNLTIERNSLGPKFNYSLASTGPKATEMLWSYTLWDSNSKSWGAWNSWQSTTASSGSYQASPLEGKTSIAFGVYARNSCGSSAQARESEERTGVSLAAQEEDAITRNLKSSPGLKVGLDVDLYLIASSKFNLELTATTSTPSVCTIDSTQIQLNARGTCKLLVSSVGYGFESGAKPTEIEFEVTERNSQKILDLNVKSQYRLSEYFIELDLRADSSLLVDFKSLTPEICNVSDGIKLYLLGTGKCLLNATQEGNDDFLPAPERTFQLTVSPDRMQSITCVKGKLVKKVTAANPKCPTGYRAKK